MGILFIWRRAVLHNLSMEDSQWIERGSFTARKKTLIPQSVWVHPRIIWILLYISEHRLSPKQDPSLKYPATLLHLQRWNKQMLLFNPILMLKVCWLILSPLLLSQRCSNQCRQVKATSMIMIRMLLRRNPNSVITIIITERISRFWLAPNWTKNRNYWCLHHQRRK